MPVIIPPLGSEQFLIIAGRYRMPTTQVEYHAGYTYAERPTALVWADQRLLITDILEHQRTPAGRFFRVATQDDHAFDLLYDESSDTWQVCEI
jgi:hypothetical protein